MISDPKALEGRAEERFVCLCAGVRQIQTAAGIAGLTGDRKGKLRLLRFADRLTVEMISSETALMALRERRYREAATVSQVG